MKVKLVQLRQRRKMMVKLQVVLELVLVLVLVVLLPVVKMLRATS